MTDEQVRNLIGNLPILIVGGVSLYGLVWLLFTTFEWIGSFL